MNESFEILTLFLSCQVTGSLALLQKSTGPLLSPILNYITLNFFFKLNFFIYFYIPTTLSLSFSVPSHPHLLSTPAPHPLLLSSERDRLPRGVNKACQITLRQDQVRPVSPPPLLRIKVGRGIPPQGQVLVSLLGAPQTDQATQLLPTLNLYRNCLLPQHLLSTP